MKIFYYICIFLLIFTADCKKKVQKQSQSSTSPASLDTSCVSLSDVSHTMIDPRKLAPPSKVELERIHLDQTKWPLLSLTWDKDPKTCPAVYYELTCLKNNSSKVCKKGISGASEMMLTSVEDNQVVSADSSCCQEEAQVSAELRNSQEPKINYNGVNYYCGNSWKAVSKKNSEVTLDLIAPNEKKDLHYQSCEKYWQKWQRNKDTLIALSFELCLDTRTQKDLIPASIAPALSQQDCLQQAEMLYEQFQVQDVSKDIQKAKQVVPQGLQLVQIDNKKNNVCLQTKLLNQMIQAGLNLTDQPDAPFPTQISCNQEFDNLRILANLKWNDDEVRTIEAGLLMAVIGFLLTVFVGIPAAILSWNKTWFARRGKVTPPMVHKEVAVKPAETKSPANVDEEKIPLLSEGEHAAVSISEEAPAAKSGFEVKGKHIFASTIGVTGIGLTLMLMTGYFGLDDTQIPATKVRSSKFSRAIKDYILAMNERDQLRQNIAFMCP